LNNFQIGYLGYLIGYLNLQIIKFPFGGFVGTDASGGSA